MTMPNDPTAQIAAARALLRAGKRAEALAAARQAHEEAPDDQEGWLILGACLLANTHEAEALAWFEKLLREQPGQPDALANRALIRLRARDMAGALQDAEAALAVKPELTHLWGTLGMLRQRAGDLRGAIEALRTGLAADPANVAMMIRLGEYLRQANRLDEAISLLETATAQAPANAAAWTNLGAALQQSGRIDPAKAAYAQALAHDPGAVQAATNMGIIERDRGDWQAALPHFERALAARPDFATALWGKGAALLRLTRLDEAETVFRQAVALQPDRAEPHWSLGLIELTRGDFASGWAGYEWRSRMADFPSPRRNFAQPLWLGDAPLDGRTLLVHWEQGLGDTIQFCRYVPLLAGRGARILFAPQPQLRALMDGLDGDFDMVGLDDPALAFDCHVPLMSLPRALGTRLDTIPGDTPYLHADPGRVADWKARIGGEGFRIGICWRGSGAQPDGGRSFPLALLAPIARIPGVRLISLQKGPGAEQVADLPSDMRVETLAGPFDAGPDAFVDSAAVMAQCDLVISCDTAIAHLGGALGVPVWLALIHGPDWRWMLGREDSPWYPGMRLFRQKERNDWAGVFAAMARELSGLVAHRAEPV